MLRRPHTSVTSALLRLDALGPCASRSAVGRPSVCDPGPARSDPTRARGVENASPQGLRARHTGGRPRLEASSAPAGSSPGRRRDGPSARLALPLLMASRGWVHMWVDRPNRPLCPASRVRRRRRSSSYPQRSSCSGRSDPDTEVWAKVPRRGQRLNGWRRQLCQSQRAGDPPPAHGRERTEGSPTPKDTTLAEARVHGLRLACSTLQIRPPASSVM